MSFGYYHSPHYSYCDSYCHRHSHCLSYFRYENPCFFLKPSKYGYGFCRCFLCFSRLRFFLCSSEGFCSLNPDYRVSLPPFLSLPPFPFLPPFSFLPPFLSLYPFPSLCPYPYPHHFLSLSDCCHQYPS